MYEVEEDDCTMKSLMFDPTADIHNSDRLDQLCQRRFVPLP